MHFYPTDAHTDLCLVYMYSFLEAINLLAADLDLHYGSTYLPKLCFDEEKCFKLKQYI